MQMSYFFDGATCTICNLLNVWSTGQKNEQQNNAPNPKNNADAGYQGPVKIMLLKGAGLLFLTKFLKHLCVFFQIQVDDKPSIFITVFEND